MAEQDSINQVIESQETWKPIAGFEDRYEVSNIGRVKRIKWAPSTYVGRILKQSISAEWGYHSVSFIKDGKEKKYMVHCLVAIAFIGKPKIGEEVNHKDGNKSNNRVSNLEYTTRSGNMLHCYRTGIHSRPRGEARYNSKFKDHQIREMRSLYADGKSIAFLARKYAVSESAIRFIVKGKSWQHVV